MAEAVNKELLEGAETDEQEGEVVDLSGSTKTYRIRKRGGESKETVAEKNKRKRENASIKKKLQKLQKLQV
jgi:hypothetical protein